MEKQKEPTEVTSETGGTETMLRHVSGLNAACFSPVQLCKPYGLCSPSQALSVHGIHIFRSNEMLFEIEFKRDQRKGLEAIRPTGNMMTSPNHI